MYTVFVMRMQTVDPSTIRGLPFANRGCTLCATIHAWIVCANCGSTLCATQSQALQTKGEGRNRKEGLRSAAQGDVRDLYLCMVKDPTL